MVRQEDPDADDPTHRTLTKLWAEDPVPEVSPDDPEAVPILTRAADDLLSRTSITVDHLVPLTRLGGALALTQSPNAIPPLVRVLSKVKAVDPDAYDYLLAWVAQLGATSLESALDMYRGTSSTEHRLVLGEYLIALGVKDARIIEIIVAEFERDAEHGAMLAYLYGDKQILPYLHDAFERNRYDEQGNEIGSMKVMLIYHTVKQLGGEFTAEQEDYVRRANAQKDAQLQAAERARRDAKVADGRRATAHNQRGRSRSKRLQKKRRKRNRRH